MKKQRKRIILFFSLLILVVGCMLYLAYFVYPDVQTIAWALLKATIGLIGFEVYDAIALKETDTYTEIIIKRNQAYATTLLAYSIIFAATIATA